MKQGHKIHKELENELHATVAMTQISTAEEIWALRFLNILFSLQELQFHGMTVLTMKTKLIEERVPRFWLYWGAHGSRYHRPNRLRA